MTFIKVYSTGPLENQALNRSTTVFTKVLNNSSNKSTKVKVLVFKLNGNKKLISSRHFTVPPKSSSFVVTDLKSNVEQFEVKIIVLGNALLGVFGKTARGNLNPSHRLVHSELTLFSKFK
ncbi:hypothetical protein [Paenibacillus sp. NEAU-GSW1]|uniref:hypothetical protein n=1 Tax=Paenibacillus sp. NEAU-GSW1 TaxID=2682486 RepID=UPI0012E1FEBB|nr:hypothetical protein [Paenibacillus sp. NEAU-GSW1]MUT68340.1 hypothetical protein [Paenibacillus sp. NEAU-GSW1]